MGHAEEVTGSGEDIPRGGALARLVLHPQVLPEGLEHILGTEGPTDGDHLHVVRHKTQDFLLEDGVDHPLGTRIRTHERDPPEQSK